MFSIAISEFRMLLRNKLVAACAILIPLAFGAFFIFTGNQGGTSVIAVFQVLIMIAMGVYVTATTTLAARRQTLFLKRLRSGAVSDQSIIVGLVLPIVVVSVVQIGIILTVLGITSGQPPANVLLVIIGVLAAEVMFTGFALATAGVTNSPEHAQITTLPLFAATLGVAVWVTYTGTTELTVLKRALPGGGLAELISTGWAGGAIDNVLLLILPSIGWAAVAVSVARAMFKWEPRA
ncbi:ABC transporter permease [Glaciihabitans arcticus]|uniref:ABC transporter permease n=1 Tax=Glaciihabitans arcticus TaxID=2668039 RepID=A0A4Q9GRJ6_9MICO|nr:ABC transporter permease [Glaciihabitans arcticus]TBN57271.1 ABC transporter permease [Glaciihabitans arcticus]